MAPSDVRIGFVGQTHTGDVSWRETIERGADLGFEFVELYMDGETERSRLDAAAVADLLGATGLDLAVHLPFVDLDLGSTRERVREASVEELEACLRAAADMGAETAVVHPSAHAGPPEWEPDALRPNVLASVRELDRFARDRDVELCVENLPDGLFTVGEFDRVFAETDASMTFDTGHARVDGMDEAAMAAFLRAHRDRVAHVHVNDSRAPADEHLPTGSGTIDFAAALAPLADGWDGTLSIEAFTFDFDYLALSRRKLSGWR